MKKYYLIAGFILLANASMGLSAAETTDPGDYHRAMWNPLHFPPAIDTATNDQCLQCHQEILDRKVLPSTLSKVSAESVRAWYQTLTTYEGPQETFHRRHLATPMASNLMNLQCTTCHQGSDSREEAFSPPDTENTRSTLRKQVNPDVCLMCHGGSDYQIMGLPSPWSESREMFQDNCLLCHSGIRTNRHQVNFLNAEAIEAAGKDNSDVCYGCHGGRQWYRIAYPYPRHAWDGMAEEIPDWAKDRPTESHPRFSLK